MALSLDPLGLAAWGALTLGNLLVMSAVLPFAMGRLPSAGARAVQRYVLLHAMAWTGLVTAGLLGRGPHTMALGIATTVAVALAEWSMQQALSHWLGPRPWRRVLMACCIAAPLGFALFWQEPAWRSGWVSAMFAISLLVLARMCLRPQLACERGWRRVLCFFSALSSLLLFARAVMVVATEAPPQFLASSTANLAFIIFCNFCYTVVVICMTAAWRDESYQQLRALAATDALTGVLNRHGFDEQAARLFAQSRRRGTALALVMLDLDHFKGINDQHGHPAGDAALHLFAARLRAACLQADVVARLGGEEFCLLLPERSPGEVLAIDRAVRAGIAADAPERLGFLLDFSAGVTWLRPDDAGLAPLLQRADRALYAAKAEGRGRLLGLAAPAVD